jgi:hypothetical protein
MGYEDITHVLFRPKAGRIPLRKPRIRDGMLFYADNYTYIVDMDSFGHLPGQPNHIA